MEHLDTIPSSNSKFALPFLCIGIASIALAITDRFYHNSIINISQALCAGIAIYFMADSLRKGLKSHHRPLTGLFVVVMILIGLAVILKLAFYAAIISGINPLQIMKQAKWTFIAIPLAKSLYILPMFIASIIMAASYSGRIQKLSILYIAWTIIELFTSVSITIATILTESKQVLNTSLDVMHIVYAILPIMFYWTVYKAIRQ